ncbi:MAG: ABC transporter ATP-binding protein [Balneola sp.]
MIELKNISFSYPDKTVLEDISLSVEKGETVSIVGASGSGKSTLLRIISGILPSRKEHEFFGTILLENFLPKEFVKTGKLSFMFQDSTLMPNLTVKENISFPLELRGIKRSNKVDEIIDSIGLSDFKSYLPKELSGGMKTRVSLARSFITEPKILLLDEPFSSLDIAWQSKLYIELEKLKSRCNTTVILVTHNVQESLLLSDHVIVLNKFGTIEKYEKIDSDFSIVQRVMDISGFMNNVYESYMLPLQDAIIKGHGE